MSLYKVQAIEGKRFNETARKMEYKVLWKGFPRSQATWQPENNLKFIPEMIEKFQKASKEGKIIRYEKDEKSVSVINLSNHSDLVGASQFDELQSHGRQNLNSMHSNTNEKKDQQTKKARKRRGRKTLNIKKTCRKRTQKGLVKRQNKEIVEQIQNKGQNLQSQLQRQRKSKMDQNLRKRHEEQPQGDLQILKISRKDSQLKFLVRHFGQMQWVDRCFLIAGYKQKLITFYEKKLKFVKKDKVNQKVGQSKVDLC